MKTVPTAIDGTTLWLPLAAAAPKKPEPFADALRDAVKKLMVQARQLDRHALNKVA